MGTSEKWEGGHGLHLLGAWGIYIVISKTGWEASFLPTRTGAVLQTRPDLAYH